MAIILPFFMDKKEVNLLGLLKKALAERGTITVRVTGDCMEPFIQEGGRVIILGEKPLHVGDVILYCPPPFDAFYLHRIIEIKSNPQEGKVYICKGDSSPTIDPPVFEDSIIGKVSHQVTVEPGPSTVDPSSRVVLSPDVFYEMQNDRLLVFNASNGTLLLLNPSLFDLVQCKNIMTISDMLEEIPDHARKRVFDVIASLVSDGILRIV